VSESGRLDTRRRRSSLRVAIDVGGTFTDVCVFDEASGSLGTAKVPTNTADPLASVTGALGSIDIDFTSVQLVTHSTTITTNALVTRRFPKAALITTEGFRDVIEIRDGTQEDPWDTSRDVAQPYIRRRDRHEVRERIDYAGRVLLPLDAEGLRELARRLVARGIRTVAVCFINSYANSQHERLAREILLQVEPTLSVSLSSDILPEINEYERFSTTVANALLASLVHDYVGRLDEYLASCGYAGDLLLLHSGGGSMTASLARRYPLRLAASSIAGGAIAARHTAAQCGYPDAIALDMGGTSCDITLVQNGQVRLTKQWWVEYGHPICFPGVELATIGAGGGTIARVDETGALRCGPDSAGSNPGPASYGRGGKEPTNTDANLLLGRLSTSLAAGAITLDEQDGGRAIASRVAEPLGLETAQAAHAMLAISDAAMANAVRLLRQSRKALSQSAPLIAFGGAGPMHGAAVARELGIRTVIVPPLPGITSALGCLLADIKHDFSAMVEGHADEVDPVAIEERFLQMEREAGERMKAESVNASEVRLERSVSMRYAGQWRSLTLPMGRGRDALARAIEDFQAEYQSRYAYRADDVPVELYQLGLSALGRLAPVSLPEREPTRSRPTPTGERLVVFDDPQHPQLTPVYERRRLGAGATLLGPAIIEQPDATTVLPPGCNAEIDRWLNVVITWSEDA
jgi:N-methylhydantoinase A